MSSSQTSSVGKRKKILRTRVKVWGRFALRPEEVFNVDKAEQLIHRAVDGKTSVQTILKMYNEGLRIGDKGVLAALHTEFISYTKVTAFISLRETPTLLALCSKTDQSCCVTVIQFKDLSALEVVCDIIDKQRGVMTRIQGAATPSLPPSSLSRSEVAGVQQPKPPTVVITAAAKPEPKAQPAVTAVEVTTAATVPTVVNSKETTTTTTTNVTRVEDVSIVVASSSSGGGGSGSVGLFEKRPFAAEITQPPASAEVTAIVHAPPPPVSKSTVVAFEDDDDDNHFRTSIVFGEEARFSGAPAAGKVVTETVERQQRMETVLKQRANGHTVVDAASKRTSAGPIDTVILNYDEVDVEGTHAVFDTPDGPPTQLNESADNVRWPRPQSLLVTASSSSNTSVTNAQRSGASRYVVTSFSSGRSDSPTESQGVYMRASPNGTGDRSYRTSTVIYRDSVDGPTERPRVTYVTNSQQQRGTYVAPPSPQLHQAAHSQPMQLVRLVPVGSARRRVLQPQHQQQFYTIQPVAARENGVHLVAK